SLGVDLATAVSITLIDNRPQTVPSTLKGPLQINGQCFGGLLIRRSSSSIKGLFVLPGVINADYNGTIQIMIQTDFPPVMVPQGSRIAQIIPLSNLLHTVSPALPQDRGDGGFGSTGGLALVTLQLGQRPTLSVCMSNGSDGTRLTMLADTGADITIVD
ncbi:POK9 protein, partial [Semnornis frantzii]|nr:POK9 protein [Semnornis frantzii]